MDWKALWDSKANTDNYFTQTGRGNSFTMFEFLLYIQDVNNALHLCKDDKLLDIGGGPGWVSMHLSPFVNSITMTDFSSEMVERAKQQVKAFGNIKVFQDNILCVCNCVNIKRYQIYNKVLISSVLQYLNNIDEVCTAMLGVRDIMELGGIALFTHNPDLRKKESHLATVPLESLEMENDRLWIDPNEIYDIAMGLGFRTCRILPINPLIWQSTHMLDFMVIK
jgi:2-polyprenyl-3-methyl-5-hydroxy-6-metoxy-1,4-benzoquinol methylase